MSGSLWSFLKRILAGSHRIPVTDNAPLVDVNTSLAGEDTTIETTNLRPTKQHSAITAIPLYDENLLDSCITQWKFGDWHSLIQMSKEQLEHHPERDKLAILVAAGHFQIGKLSAAKEFIQTAISWGCSQRVVSQILIAGVHNSLGRAAVLSQEPERALSHFKVAITVGTPKSEVTLFVKARAAEQIRQTTSHLLVTDDA